LLRIQSHSGFFWQVVGTHELRALFREFFDEILGFETPKAFANSSPGFERREKPWVNQPDGSSTLKGLIAHRPNAFSVGSLPASVSQGCRFAPTLG